MISYGTKWELHEYDGFYYLRLYLDGKEYTFIQVPIGTLKRNTGASIASIIARHSSKKEKV